MNKTIVVIPCYNESERLAPEAFIRVLENHPSLSFQFVNDGSTDQTLDVLRSMEELHPSRIGILDLEKNSGKAEAVRQGILAALNLNPEYVGYWDADLATPLETVLDFCRILESPGVDLVIGSRVRLLGRKIERRTMRHYLGRAFATCASILLEIGIYDTQCGAKLFRNSGITKQVFEKPFLVHWIFDVEMLARFIILTGGSPSGVSSRWVEYPLDEWVDVQGSKIRTSDFFRAWFEFVKLLYYLKPGQQQYRKFLIR